VTTNGNPAGPDPPTYRLTLRALRSEVPPTIRLRSVLKRLLRTFQFRCLEVQEMRDVPPDLGRTR
jgi:hypothetical protein